MKRIILTTSLFFCLAITTVFAQVTPVNTTKTSTSTVGGVTVIGIATPVNGLSNNTYSDFNISNSGIILNNSGSDSSSQLTSGIVSGNSNITGSPASLILNQVTSTSTNVSSLSGTAEVVGNKAGIIIANPNGITCAGCGFINADRVDLVTGTYNIATGTYSISDNDFTVNTGGLLANTVGVLNIQTNNFTNNDDSPGVSADTFNLSVAGDFNNAGIDVNTFNLSLAGDFNQRQYLEIHANTFNLSVAGDFDHIAYYSVVDNGFITNSEGRLYVDALNLNVGGDFSFSESANDFIWRENDILTVSGSANIIAASFNNSGNIYVDNSFNATVNSFINQAGATITTFGECNIVATSSTDNGTITCLNSVGETTILDIARPDNGLSNNSYEPFHISINGVVFNNSDSTTTSQLLGDDISKNPNYDVGDAASIILAQVSGPNSFLFGALEVVGDEAAVIIANPNGITCNGCGFINASRVDLVTGSNYDFNTNTFGSIAASDINIASSGLTASVLKIQTGADFNNAGPINADNLNITAGADFSNSATINADTVTIDVTSFASNIANSGTVSSDSLNFILTADFTHASDSFTAFNINNLTVSTDGAFTNNSAINLAGVNLTITANSFNNTGEVVAGTFTLSGNGDFDYVNSGTITANTFNLNVDGDFSNNDAASDFTWSNNYSLNVSGNANITTNNYTQSGAIDVVGEWTINTASDFIYNRPNNNFIWDKNDSLTVSGNASIDAADFDNSGTINVTNSSFNATVVDFINRTGATISAFGNCNIVATSSSDSGTITCKDFAIEAMVINIETPDANGLSYNQVDVFNVNAEGTVLNNSASRGTAQLGNTAVAGNSNITGSEEADLILFQVATASALNGTIEVFGGNAGLIIANPNGITCNGCAFINTNRLDLVTGSNYDLNTNTFGDIAAADITVGVSGLDAPPILNIQTGADFNNAGSINTDNLNITAEADFNNAGSINTDNLNITAGDDFANNSVATINADTVTIDVTNFANDINNTGTVSSTNLNFILTDNFTHISTSLSGFNFSNLAISTNGAFTNNDTIDLAGVNIEITAASFNNTGGVVAGTFTLSGNGNFDYVNSGTITANTFNLKVDGNFSNNDSASDFTWSNNYSLNVSGNANITTNKYTQSGAITVEGDWTIKAESDFIYNRPNNDFIWGANDTLTVSGNADITATDFTNTGKISVNTTLNTTVTSTVSGSFNNTGGEIDAATFNLDVAGDFDYIADYANGTITTNALNLSVGGDFSNNDSASDFTWRTNDTLTVSGNASIDAASFANSGIINVTNIFDITAAADFNNSGTISVTNSFDITAAADFANSGTINVTNIFDITAAADFANSGIINATNIFDITATNFTNTSTISANSFNAIVDSFINQSGATITAGECNLVVHTSSSDNGTITCLNSEGDAEVVDIATPFNGLSRNDYTDFNIPINGVVFNNSDSDATSQLLGDISKNPNINSGNAASIILAQVSGTNSLLFGALEVVGAEAVVIIANPNGISCNGCSFINASRVDLVTASSYNRTNDSFDNIANTNIAIIENGLDASSVGILNIRAGSFTNTGVLQANTFNLFVDDFDYTEKGIINATIFNLEVDDVFSYEDESIGFVWEENDTLTVLGSANITTNNFINHGTIDITGSGSFEIITDYTAINQGSIVSENGSLNITTYDFFRNLTGGDIAVNTLNIIAGGKVTNTATIDVATLSITASDDSSRTNDTTGFYVSNRGNIIATTLNITAVDNFYNRGNITATNFTTSAKSVFFLNKEIDSYDGTYDGGNIFLNGDSSFIADGGDGVDGGIIENYGNIDLGVFNLDITANSFTNHEGATIDAATLNLNVSSYINDGTIDAVVISDATIDQ